MQSAGRILGAIVALVPISAGLAAICLMAFAESLEPGTEPSREQLGWLWFCLRWMTILGAVAPFAIVPAVLAFWVANWSDGFVPAWTTIVLIAAAFCTLACGSLGVLPGLITLILAVSSQHLAFWK